MAIFNSYVKLPEDIPSWSKNSAGKVGAAEQPPSQRVVGSECLCELSTPEGPGCFVQCNRPHGCENMLNSQGKISKKTMANHDSYDSSWEISEQTRQFSSFTNV
jgi:hypothetical protein